MTPWFWTIGTVCLGGILIAILGVIQISTASSSPVITEQIRLESKGVAMIITGVALAFLALVARIVV